METRPAHKRVWRSRRSGSIAQDIGNRRFERRDDRVQKDIDGLLIYSSRAPLSRPGWFRRLKRRILDADLFKDAVRRAAGHRIGPDLLQSCLIDSIVEVMLRDSDHAMGRFDFDKAG
jgi:hypothetical protein